jgi:hypothetical protein
MGKHSADVPAFMAEPTDPTVRAMETFVDATLRPVVKATRGDAGVWVDGVRGWMAEHHMIDLAVGHGWPITADDDRVINACRGQLYSVDDSESLREIADDAEAFMNDHVAPLGYAFGWHEGDFILASEATWCAVNDGTCYCVEPHPAG